MPKFVVFAESARPVEPGEGALNDPALGQHLKDMLFVSFDDLDGVAEHIAGPVDQFSCIAAVGEDLRDRIDAAEQPHQYSPRRDPVLDTG